MLFQQMEHCALLLGGDRKFREVTRSRVAKLRPADLSAGDTLGEIDHLAPVQTSIDPADLAAGGQVHRDVVSVPVWKVGKLQPTIVVLAD